MQAPPIGAKKGKGKDTSSTRGLMESRVREHSDVLSIEAGSLFCKACREQLSAKLSAVNSHFSSTKHATAVAAAAKRTAAQAAADKTLVEHFEEHNAKGSTRAIEESRGRLRVVRTMMAAGIPLQKLNHTPFRQLLETNSVRLTSASHMRQLVPVALKLEMEALKLDLKGQLLTIVFDGASTEAEVLAVIARYALAPVDQQQATQCSIAHVRYHYNPPSSGCSLKF